MSVPSDPWPRLEAFLAAHLPRLRDDLAPGADEAALDALAHRTGLALPDDFRALYRGHDGQRGVAPGLFFGLRFLPTDEAGEEWHRWGSLLQGDPSLVETITVTAQPEGAVQAVYATPEWLPFASDGAGNHLAVDLAPGPDGTPGQVIAFGADEPVRRVLAPSARDFLAWCAHVCERGEAVVAPDAAAPGGQVLRLPEASHLLDALRVRD
jgi:cell wall assembly regulator SMI1